MNSWHFYPENFSSYEEYVNYLKEKGLALEAPEGMYKTEQNMRNIIEINGIKYKEVPAKTNDKICKDCAYFLNNGKCTFDECPCSNEDNILDLV